MVLNNGKTSLSSLVGMESKRQVDGLDEEINELSWRRSKGVKLRILSLKKLMQSLPLRAIGIHGSIEL